MKTEIPCRYYKKYKAIYSPKCNCQPCQDKYDVAHSKNRAQTWAGIAARTSPKHVIEVQKLFDMFKD